MAKYPKRFYFEQKWMLEDDFADCVEQGWSESVLLNLPDQLSACSHVMKRWAGQRFNKLGKQIYHLRNEMEYLWTLTPIKDNLARILRLEKKLEKLNEQEELHWYQRSRANWLKRWR